MKSNKKRTKTKVFVIIEEDTKDTSVIKFYPNKMRYKTVFSTNKAYILNKYNELPTFFTRGEEITTEVLKTNCYFDEVYEIENTKESIEKEIFLIGI